MRTLVPMLLTIWRRRVVYCYKRQSISFPLLCPYVEIKLRSKSLFVPDWSIHWSSQDVPFSEPSCRFSDTRLRSIVILTISSVWREVLSGCFNENKVGRVEQSKQLISACQLVQSSTSPRAYVICSGRMTRNSTANVKLVDNHQLLIFSGKSYPLFW